ncbi:MAG: hypothetical protein IJE51_05255 [Clostridia bacterium]|nr:hypothetical protein [Clostridia bacterium]
MKNTNLLHAMGRIDHDLIAEAAPDTVQKKTANNIRIKWTAVAACLVLLLSVGLGTYAYSEEVKEYNAAIKFFNDHALSMEGLTRGEIKKVYLDITTESFSYSKTAEVIADSLNSEQIGGFEILQENPTSEDVENLWNYMNNGGFGFPIIPQDGIHYKYDSEYTEDGQFRLIKSNLEKYDGETLLWRASVSDFEIHGYTEVSDGVIAYGRSSELLGFQYANAWLAKFDSDGELLWKQALFNGFEQHEYISAVLENEDGSVAVISRGDLRYLCLNQYSADGKLLHFKKTDVGNYGIWNAARLDDGYIVQLGSYIANEYAKIVKMDMEGNITESFSYSSEDRSYCITDMIEFNGNIYLSAYAVPKFKDEEPIVGRSEISDILHYIFSNDLWKISDEELTPLVREKYTAILLKCDHDSGTPQEFYSVDGSIGGSLSLSDSGNLLWDVESITTTFFSPATSSFTIGGTCYVFRYSFDGSGALVSQEKTDEVTTYRR